jgi:o-succinylbenzoate---CoA ligase
MSTLSIFDAARETPDAVALVDGERELTFAEVAERTRPLAHALATAKLHALAFTPRADVQSLLWLYAALATGTTVVPLHQRATPSERAHVLALSGASEPPLPLPHEGELPVFDIDDESLLAILPTSGSTGAPRLVKLSRRALAVSAHASARNLGWEPNDRWLLCLPLAHTGGLSIVVRCLLARKAVALFEPGPLGMLARLPELQHAIERVSLVSLVPSVLDALLDAGFVAPAGLRAVLLGGAGCAPSLAERAHAAQIPLLTSYGLTETASQVVTRRYAERYQPLPVRYGVVSSGHSLSGVTLRLEAETISINSASLFSGYVGEQERALDGRGFYVTSDRGELGDDGELYVRGRHDDVIVSGGENIDPLEVEAALLSLPAVQSACVFGTPSEKFGEVVSALLVTSDASLSDPKLVAAALESRLARHKLPRRVLVTEQLPLTATGKVDRRACRARLLANPSAH